MPDIPSSIMRLYPKTQVIAVLPALALLCACQTDQLRPADEISEEVPVNLISSEPLIAGSLYREATAVRLFNDHKAYRVGDILTVTLDEQTRSSKQANTNINKKNKVDMPDPTIFGRTGAHILGKGHSLANIFDVDRAFTGKGTTGQSNMLVGSVTVMVQSVLDNGSLYVRGKKTIRLTQGDEVLFLCGFVRPEDISPDNRVSSRRLADARISYTGKGDLTEANTQGWFSRILNSRWFPF